MTSNSIYFNKCDGYAENDGEKMYLKGKTKSNRKQSATGRGVFFLEKTEGASIL